MKRGTHQIWIGPLAAVFMACLLAAPAAADVAYLVTVNTSAVHGTAGFLDFQFNSGGGGTPAATAVITNFTSPGGSAGAVNSVTGDVSGALPGTVRFDNLPALNELFQNFNYGSNFSFVVVLSGAALNPPSGNTLGTVFGVGLYDSTQTPILTNQGAGTGFAGEIDILFDGTVATTGFPSNSNGGPTVVTFTPISLPGSYQVRYGANLGSGQSVINLTNAGTNGGNDATDYICANVYVFAQDQQLISCCACPLSPNDLQTLSIQNDLINNTLTPGVPTGVTVALLASDDTGKGACNAATVNPAKLVQGLRAWGTTLHAAPGGSFAVTETPFSQATIGLGPGSEFAKMTSFCGFIQADGSKYGICNSCKPGAQAPRSSSVASSK